MPGGMRNGATSSLASASPMKSTKIGAAALDPVSFSPRVRGLSKPTKTPTARSGENPTNQASKLSLVVPVLPASGRLSALARQPVPRCTTPSSSATIW